MRDVAVGRQRAEDGDQRARQRKRPDARVVGGFDLECELVERVNDHVDDRHVDAEVGGAEQRDVGRDAREQLAPRARRDEPG
ncbi:hypothetical protein [Burkholderia anthina]|uniref:hypothetical protein n=1 Tax=Burkholderia anthina TaxID=179879 RepID=UPI0015896EBC